MPIAELATQLQRSAKSHPTLVWNPDQGDPFEFFCQTYRANWLAFTLLLGKNCIILPSAVFSQYTCVTDDRQRDRRHYDNELQRTVKNVSVVSRAYSRATRLMLLPNCLFYFLPANTPRPRKGSQRNFPRRRQMGWNRKRWSNVRYLKISKNAITHHHNQNYNNNDDKLTERSEAAPRRDHEL